jgi:hypothetical protein
MKKIEKIWTELLDQNQNSNSKYLIRLVHKSGLNLAIETSSSHKVIIFELSDTITLDANDLPNWKGLAINIENNLVLDHFEKGLTLKLLDDNNEEFFNYFVDKMIQLLDYLSENDPHFNKKPNQNNENDSVDNIEPVTIIIDFLNKMDEFFTHFNDGLSPFGQQGLYGELYLLNKLLDIMPQNMAIKSWRGHNRENQDFSFGKDIFLEVKTCAQKEHRNVTISNEKQLDDNGLSKLFLYVLCIKRLKNSGVTLNQIISEMQTKIVSQADQHRFDEYLTDAGYFEKHSNLYDDTGYHDDKELTYLVTPNMPRLIDSDLPNGVGLNSYTIALSACQDNLIETEPAINEIVDSVTG